MLSLDQGVVRCFHSMRVAAGLVLWMSFGSSVLAAEPLPSAKDEKPAVMKCALTVRLIAPTDVKDAHYGEVHMSSFVADANEQLQGLPFNGYRPLAIREAEVFAKQSAEFILSAEDTPRYKLQVSPQSLEEERVCLRVDWSEESGRSIVSTRIKVPNGENIVLGSDTVPGGPMLVIIKPKCR